jgi:aspartate carbamoyltransferase regulatory subunit
MKDFKIGDVEEFEGVKRIVTGFTLVAGEMCPNTEIYTESEDTANEPQELKCQYCGKTYKDASWLESHEEKCKENPKNQEIK